MTLDAKPAPILVVEPDSRLRQVLGGYLRRQGHEVLESADAEHAEALAAEVRPGLILGDLTTAQIASLSRGGLGANAVPVVLVARLESAREVVEAMRAGAGEIVLKPLESLDQLGEAVERLLERQRLCQLNQSHQEELEATNKALRVRLEELRADQRAGRHVQLKLFPEAGQEVAGIRLDHLIKPSLYLSGDFIDYFRIDERHIVFYLADVSGHGASSAFVTVLLKNLTNRLRRNLRRGSSDDLHDPRQLLARVNSELLETGLGKHLTMFAGLLDVSSRRLIYSLGAHFPMPILKVGQKVEFLAGSGMPVGLFENAQFALYELELPPGFSLLLFSDGILEVLRAKSIADKEVELLDVLARTEPTIESLDRAFGLGAREELPDDIALLIISEAMVDDVQL